MEHVQYNSANVRAILASVKVKASEEVESETVEFKEYSSPASLYNDKGIAEELCALGNHRGGVLIVGVRDSKNIKNKSWPTQLVGFEGADPPEVLSRLAGRLRNALGLRVEIVDFENKTFLAIYIEKNMASLVGTTSGKTCLREGRSSRPMLPEEITAAVKSLQTYDWSADTINAPVLETLDLESVQAAKSDFCSRRGIAPQSPDNNFLEAISATKNGLLTKGGLLFLGKPSAIKQYLGDFEYRFTWRSGVQLKMNEVWAENLWESIKKAKALFERCTNDMEFTYKNQIYKAPNLDPLAFHEALINAMVHRDYAKDGMISVDYTGDALVVASPGEFYGGVNADNIAFHEPRHRNKSLARTFMNYQLVDRAGMGIHRMGVNSLVYGRAFPKFEEVGGAIRVSMAAEYLRPGIFVLTEGKKELFIPDLIILNILYERTHVPLYEAFDNISKIATDSWSAVQNFIKRWDQFVELCGSKEDLSLVVKGSAKDYFNVQTTLKPKLGSEKYVSLFSLLKNHGSLPNEDILEMLQHGHSSTTSRFLRETKWVSRSGEAKAARWRLENPYG
ncbi:MAG: RNA-binding domain-containing protein [Oligoflexales bacterium]